MVRVVPLGGLGEIGLNAMAFESADSVILVDAGLMFPDGRMPGIGYVVPDFAYLRERRDKVRAVFLTHGHEDHIGALPHLLKALPAPVYGTPFTLGLAAHRCDEAEVAAELRPLAEGEPIVAGGFRVEAFRVAHSIPQGVGLIVRAGGQTLVHTGDFKLDAAPVDGRATALERLGEVGEEGVSCLFSDSTNAEVETPCRSESHVAVALERLLSEAHGRVVVALFSSHLVRARHVLAACRRLGRTVVVHGRALGRNVELARRLGYLDAPDSLFAPAEAAALLPPSQVLVLTSGSQAEPRSGLAQMAFDPEAPLRIRKGDTVVFSARVIPGNERPISELVDRLWALGATVVQGDSVHVSGHAAKPDQRALIEAVRPNGFVPIHGEVRHLVHHIRTAEACGVAKTLLARDGDVVVVDGDGPRVAGTTPCGRVLHDLWGEGTVPPEAVADRVKLAEAGVIVAVVALDGARMAGPPVLTGRGLSWEEMMLLPDATLAAREQLGLLSAELLSDRALVEETLTRAIRSFVKQRTGKRPSVLPVVVKVS